MDSILVLDTSGSMSGASLRELKRAVVTFIETTEQLGLKSQIALVEFGKNTCVRCSFTSNYSRLISAVNDLSAGGGTPMAEGLALAFKELVEHGRVLEIEGISIFPKIILMTDGAPDDADKVIKLATAIGSANFPIACVGVQGCNQQLMARVAASTEGMFLMAENIEALSAFFLKQVLLVLYIVEMANSIERLLNRELLRAFLEEKTGRRVSDLELQAFIGYLEGIARNKRQASPPQRQQQRLTSSSNSTYSYQQQRAPQRQRQRPRSSDPPNCCVLILCCPFIALYYGLCCCLCCGNDR